MPALITHYLFATEALKRDACAATVAPFARDDAQRTAFVQGCQGPDPLFFCVFSLRGATVRKLAHEMHVCKVSDAFEHLKRGIDQLADEDRAVGRAFACGVLSHYALDRRAHAYVFARQYDYIAQNPQYAYAHHEIHATIESEIDCGMLDHYRGLNTAQLTPLSVLESNPQAERVAGTLLANMARDVYGISIRPGDYAVAASNQRGCFRAIEPHGSLLSRAMVRGERLVRRRSQLNALSHRTDLGMAGNESMNSERRTWTDPFVGGDSNESFIEVFERALGEYPQLAEAFLNGGPLRELVGRINYDAQPMDKDENELP